MNDELSGSETSSLIRHCSIFKEEVPTCLSHYINALFYVKRHKGPMLLIGKCLPGKVINLRLDITTKSTCVVTSTLYKNSWISAAGHHAI